MLGPRPAASRDEIAAHLVVRDAHEARDGIWEGRAHALANYEAYAVALMVYSFLVTRPAPPVPDIWREYGH